MIRVLNIKHIDSSSQGWRVNTSNIKRPFLEIVSPYIDDVKIPFNPDDYENLTLPGGVDPRSMSIIKSVDIDGKKVFALCSTDDPDEDKTILAYNLETEVGETITSVNFVNCVAISATIKTVDFRDVFCGIFEIIDPSKPLSISLYYGYIGGRSLSHYTITYDSNGEHKLSPIISKDVLRIEDGIQKQEIVIPMKEQSA